MSRIWIPTGIGSSDFTEKKSRFIGEARRVRSAEEARDRIRNLRESHPRARHVCWAYVLGADGSQPGLSDDGEPHGTAGRSILDPIVGSALTETLVTVVRYFGGVKLGTGGLAAAYGRSSREALEQMPREPLIRRTRIVLSVDYAGYEPLVRLGRRLDGRVLDERFDSDVRVSIAVPADRREEFLRGAADLTRGTLIIHPDP